MEQAYYTALMGARGHVFGDGPIWLFDPGWPEALGSAGAAYMSDFAAFVVSREGYGFLPDTQQQIVVAGYGDPNGQAAAHTPSGASVVIYLPTAGRRISLDTSLMHLASPPGAPWVLVLDDEQRNLPAPGQPLAP
jgi:hypothetical protein